MFIYAILLGIVQGITEFLPISSSGHLILIPNLLNMPDQGLAVDAALHLATALAIFVYFRWDWWNTIKSWRNRNSLIRKIVIASIPAGLAGLLFNDFVETVLRSPWVVVVMLVAIAGVILWVESNYTEVRKVGDESADVDESDMMNISWLQAIIIGLFQVIALVPGTSRSGITMAAGMWQTLSRRSAAKFSFMLGAPITLGAGLVKSTELVGLAQSERQFVIFAALVTFIVALLTIRWLLRFLSSSTLKPFAYYRIVLAVGVAIFLLAA